MNALARAIFLPALLISGAVAYYLVIHIPRRDAAQLQETRVQRALDSAEELARERMRLESAIVRPEPQSEPVPPREGPETYDVETSPMDFEAVFDDPTGAAQHYLDYQASNDLDGLIGLYDGEVDYYNRGRVGRGAIRDDKAYYFDRWPLRSYRLDGPIDVTSVTSSSTTMRFTYAFDVEGRDRHRNGRAWAELTLDSGSGLILRERGGSL